jgi:putative ABC transport system permease protein
VDAFFRDIKHSVRMFLKTPGFTVTAISALALGIGANTAIFSVVNAVVLKPLPVPDPERFVMLMNTFVSDKGESRSGPGASPRSSSTGERNQLCSTMSRRSGPVW